MKNWLQSRVLPLVAVAVLLGSLVVASLTAAQNATAGGDLPLEQISPGKTHGPLVSLVSAPIPTVIRGKSGTLDLRFHVATGYHVNSNKPAEEFMIPTALHLDAAWSERQPFGQRLMNSMMTLATLVGLSVEQLTQGTIVANLGFGEVRFPAPMYHGDTLYAETRLLSSTTRPCPAFTVLDIGPHLE